MADNVMQAIAKLIHDHSFNAVDGTAVGVTLLSFAQLLPYISAGLSAIWVGLRIYLLIRDEFLKKDK